MGGIQPWRRNFSFLHLSFTFDGKLGAIRHFSCAKLHQLKAHQSPSPPAPNPPKYSTVCTRDLATMTSDSQRDGASVTDGCWITSCPRHRPLHLPRGLLCKTLQGQQGQLRPEDGQQGTLPGSSSPGLQRPPQGDQDVNLWAIIGCPTPSSDAAYQPGSTSQLAEHLQLQPRWRWQSGAVRPAAPALGSGHLFSHQTRSRAGNQGDSRHPNSGKNRSQSSQMVT